MTVERDTPLRSHRIRELALSLAGHDPCCATHDDVLGLTVSVDVHRERVYYVAVEHLANGRSYLVEHGTVTE